MSLLTGLLAAEPVPPSDLLVLSRETLVASPLDETFAFFADAGNLQRLTPTWLHFSIRTPMPITMREGVEIEYQIRLYGVPIPWRTRIDVWEPGRWFVDRQVTGPYRWWHHEHRFEATPDGTRVIDRVQFAPRAAWLTRGLVRRDLERIFTYRQETIRSILG
jgi:ligand-binding SRPBCC domain-containing protein